MPTTITGTDGVSQVQTGAVESGDLPAGSVIQVVSEGSTGEVSTTSTSFVSANLSASITPTSINSNILIIVSFNFRDESDVSQASLQRDSSEIINFGYLRTGLTGGNGIIYTPLHHLDTPNTTLSVSYQINIKSFFGDKVVANYSDGSGSATSRITLMEVAQ